MGQENLTGENLFPQASDIPQTLLKYIPCIQTGYLANGEIQVWDGPRQEVLSPVWVAGDNGPKPFFIGEYPHLTELNKQIITRIVREHKNKFLATGFILQLGGFYAGPDHEPYCKVLDRAREKKSANSATLFNG